MITFCFFQAHILKCYIFGSRNAVLILQKAQKNLISWQETKVSKSLLMFTLVLIKQS